MATNPNYTAILTEEEFYDGQQVTELPVVEYEFVGSMYMFELADGSSLSLGTGLVESVQPVDEATS